MYKSRSTE